MKYHFLGTRETTGKAVVGDIEADDEAQALARLRERGIVVETEALSIVPDLLSTSPGVVGHDRYGALALCVPMYKVLSVLHAIIALGAVIGGVTTVAFTPATGVLLILGGVVYGVVMVTTCLAISQGIRLFFDIGRTVHLVRGLARPQPGAPGGPRRPC